MKEFKLTEELTAQDIKNVASSLKEDIISTAVKTMTSPLDLPKLSITENLIGGIINKYFPKL